MRKIALIAGETSGDQLGGRLIEELKKLQPDVQLIGIGSETMQAQGLQSLFPMQEISLMGFAEILPHIFRLKRRIHETVAFLEREKPEILVTIDSPGFVFRVVKSLRERGLIRPKFIHYVAPTVWAYKPQRAAKTAALFDRLLVLLPFEPPYFDAVGLKTDFVGHESAWWWKSRGDGNAFRKQHSIAADVPLLAVFPGSRNGELNRLLPVFRQTIAELKRQIPALEVLIQVPERLLPRLEAEIISWSTKVHLFSSTQEKKDLFAAATVALAKSGTISLECSLAGLPSVTAYRANALTAWIVRRMLITPYVNLANILANHMAIPELLQEQCVPEKLAAALLPLLANNEVRAEQQRELAGIAAMLGANDSISPSEKAAKIILSA